MSSPRALGFRMPAEWAPHRATWLGWPHNRSDWPGKLAPIPWVYGEIVRKLTPGEQVCILVNSPSHQAQASRVLWRVGVGMEAVEFYQLPTDRGWTRDFGPFFIRCEQPHPEVAVVRFHFNAWAKYPDWELDCQVPLRVAQQRGLRLFEASTAGRPVVLEGGSIEVNGEGVLLTTEECLLDPEVQVRNPDLGREEMEVVLGDYLGAEQVLWLGRGIAGDDTHGHIDDLCRFVNPRTVVLAGEPDGRDENHRPLEENRERLEGFRLRDGSRLEVVRLPMPAPLYLDGQRLPASYANFYIGNSAVLVPTFNDPRDRQALGLLAELFPDRQVLGIHAVDLVWGLGTLHCLTQQEPAI
ncbi:MAG: agmatine deiminase family protein [Candidatus Latescibacteria bacterium]|nr:agmatine deiminase family protein [Candidatus Latescibacterota bacterium]